MMNKILLWGIVPLLFNSLQSVAQSTLNSSSLSISSGNYVIESSIGEMVLIQTETSERLVLTQGILQPHLLVNKVSAFNEDHLQSMELSVYPNPTSGILNISTNTSDQRELHLTLYDASAHVIYDKRTATDKTGSIKIDLSGFASGMYFLMLTCKSPRQFEEKFVYAVEKIQ